MRPARRRFAAGIGGVALLAGMSLLLGPSLGLGPPPAPAQAVADADGGAAGRLQGVGGTAVDAGAGGAGAGGAGGSGGAVDAGAGGVGSGDAGAGGAGVVDVVEVSGYLDPIMADFIERSIRTASAQGSLGLVLQVNSSRAVIDDDRLRALAAQIRASEVPVSMWIGPSGAVARGAVGQLAGVVTDLALAPGSELGDLGPLILLEHDLSEPFADAHPQMIDRTLAFEEAIDLGLAREAPTLPFFVLDLPGFETEIDAGGAEPVRVPVSIVRFAKLSLLDQFMHTAASPALAYLLLLVGGGLLIFELYTAGVGLVGGLGAVSLLLGCYGLAALPVRGWAIALLVVAFFGYAVDIQVGVPRAWTVIATLCLVAGSLTLFRGVTLSWVTLLAGTLGTFAGMVAGMPAMVRTRFGTPTIGRDWMIGALGTARGAVDPDGVVVIDGAPWRARTHRATPIGAGDPVRVASLEGLLLTVEPAEPAEPVESAESSESSELAEPVEPTPAPAPHADGQHR